MSTKEKTNNSNELSQTELLVFFIKVNGSLLKEVL